MRSNRKRKYALKKDPVGKKNEGLEKKKRISIPRWGGRKTAPNRIHPEIGSITTAATSKQIQNLSNVRT